MKIEEMIKLFLDLRKLCEDGEGESLKADEIRDFMDIGMESMSDEELDRYHHKINFILYGEQ